MPSSVFSRRASAASRPRARGSAPQLPHLEAQAGELEDQVVEEVDGEAVEVACRERAEIMGFGFQKSFWTGRRRRRAASINRPERPWLER